MDFIEFVRKANIKHYNLYSYLYLIDKGNVMINCKIHGNFKQNIYNHLRGFGCSECSGKKKYSNEKFIEESIKLHGDEYDYSKVYYINKHKKVDIICKKHGIFQQTPHSHLSGHKCAKCFGNANLTSESFIEKSKIKHGDKYDYSKINYVNILSEVKIICKKHGEFYQVPNNHLQGSGCQICSGTKLSCTSDFINKSINIHGSKYNYNLVEYINSKTKVKIICTEHGEFSQSAQDHLSGRGCPKCKKSKGETKIENILIENNVNYKPQYSFCDLKYKSNILILVF